jgi:saccharopine dehydrogenase (NAD+, L-lysine forming)
MAHVLIIGAGAVGGVTTHKLAQATDVFSRVTLASRSLGRCQTLAGQVKRPIGIEQVDADDAAQVEALIRRLKPDVLVNVALPFQNLAIMDACLATGTPYVDTACYESLDNPNFSYTYQWPYHERFQQAGITAVLGCGFDPGVTNAWCAYALKHHLDELTTLDILDVNAGSHGYPFATNFNPEVNIREIKQDGKYWENGAWRTVGPFEMRWDYEFPEGLGKHPMYLKYHEELETLTKHIPTLQRARFWMGFSEQYIQHIRCFENIGLTGIKPIMYEGRPIVPLQFLKALLPDPSTLGARYTGKCCIGNLMTGKKDGKEKTVWIYNICDHQACYRETYSQGIAYTAGVPPALAAILIARKQWVKPGVWNVEQLDPDPFMDLLNERGLPWKVEVR